MEKIGIFYGSTGGNTKSVAERLAKALGNRAELHNIENATPKMIDSYKYLIFGTSAWGIGDMQDDWEYFIYELDQVKFDGKKVALFGLGDQVLYADSFVDGLGTLYCRLPNKEVVVGQWPIDGYKFAFSLAEKDGSFVGLVLDEENQADQTEARIMKWVKMLEKEFV
jgi:flavodoxin I